MTGRSSNPRPRGRGPSMLLAALLLPACTDSPGPIDSEPGPCDRADACVVTGTDLVVGTPRLLWPDDAPTDPVTGLRVADPDAPLLVEISLHNRGSETTDTTSLIVVSWYSGNDGFATLAVPRMKPGDALLDTVELSFETAPTLHSDSARVDAYFASPIQDDPIYANDHGQSEFFHVAVPIVVATITLDETTTRIGDPFSFTVTLENRSRHADTAPMRMAFCFWDFDVGCGSWMGVPFGLADVPALPAQSSWTFDTTLVVPFAAHEWWYPQPWTMMACLGDADATIDDFGIDGYPATYCVGEGAQLETLPALEETCEVAVISSDTTLTDDAATDCVDDTYWQRRLDVYAVDVLAGDTLIVTGSLYDAQDVNGGSVEESFGQAEDGRYMSRIVSVEDRRVYLLFSPNAYPVDVRRLP